MMNVTLWSQKCVGVEGSKACWKICMNDVVELGEETYVRLNPNNRGLISLVDGESERKTLQGSLGLASLVRLRNESQVSELQRELEAEKPSCDLFAAPTPDAEPRAKRRSTLVAMKARRLAPEALDVEVELEGGEKASIRMLRPVHTKDNLFIKYDATNVANAIRLLRHEGFEEGVGGYKRAALPPGIWQRGDKLAVPHGAKGAKRIKLFKDLQQALAFQAQAADGEEVVEGEASEQDAAANNVLVVEDEASAGNAAS